MCRDFSCFAVTFAAVGGGVNTRLQSGANVLFVSSLWAAVAETFVELAAVFFSISSAENRHIRYVDILRLKKIELWPLCTLLVIEECGAPW